jgi:hypothetical protein
MREVPAGTRTKRNHCYCQISIRFARVKVAVSEATDPDSIAVIVQGRIEGAPCSITARLHRIRLTLDHLQSDLTSPNSRPPPTHTVVSGVFKARVCPDVRPSR